MVSALGASRGLLVVTSIEIIDLFLFDYFAVSWGGLLTTLLESVFSLLINLFSLYKFV